MSKYVVKTYVVQKADRQGNLGEVIAVKLTHLDAHIIARANAPAKVTLFMADKGPIKNSPGQASDQPNAINCTTG